MVKFTIDKNKENPYVMLNKTPLSDDRISWRAKGIWAYLLSKPDNWTVREKDIMNKSTEGRDAVRGAIKELVEYGYIRKIELREKGKYIGIEYSVFESPIETKTVNPSDVDPSPEKPSTVEKSSSAIPLPEKPSTVKPTTANPPHSNTNVTNKPINNKRTTTEPLVKPVVVAPILKINEDTPQMVASVVDGDSAIDLPGNLTMELLVKLAIKWSKVHSADIVDRQFNNLKSELARNEVKDCARWITAACRDNYASIENVNLFAQQEVNEDSQELIEAKEKFKQNELKFKLAPVEEICDEPPTENYSFLKSIADRALGHANVLQS